MPAGVLVTIPAPVPALETVSAKVGVNVAVTAVAAVRVTAQGPVPVQMPPLQPVKTDPVAGVAVSVTTVPLTKLAVQMEPQSIPPGVLVTAPAAPALKTVTAKTGVKVAVTAVAAVSVTMQGPVPVQVPPLQPVKTDPAAGVAVSVTTVPLV